MNIRFKRDFERIVEGVEPAQVFYRGAQTDGWLQINYPAGHLHMDVRFFSEIEWEIVPVEERWLDATAYCIVDPDDPCRLLNCQTGVPRPCLKEGERLRKVTLYQYQRERIHALGYYKQEAFIVEHKESA